MTCSDLIDPSAGDVTSKNAKYTNGNGFRYYDTELGDVECDVDLKNFPFMVGRCKLNLVEARGETNCFQRLES
jgi:hypothetical protein